MKKILATLMLVFAMFALMSCNLGNLIIPGDNNSDVNSNVNKRVPVYQGMTITSISTATRTPALGNNKDDFDYSKDNGKHNGHFKGDSTDKDEDIDEENPFPDNSGNDNIEEEIKSSLKVIGSTDTIYYAIPNEDIYINIHINNPDNFEIMSFTLNGKKYSSYMFEDGSDMETIVLKHNVGNVSGIIEYTIDAIKYIDGTEIKDVIIDGNKTVIAGVQTNNQVIANVSNLDIDTNTLFFNVNIKDNDSLVEFSSGVLKAVLYDGFEIIAEKDLTVGTNDISFDSLKTNTLYQYAVVGYYDDLSGDGFKMNLLYKDAFYTDAIVLFDNISIGQKKIEFSFAWHENYQETEIASLNLYCGDSFVREIPVNATIIDNLLSNTTYKIVAKYKNLNKTESIYLEFTTYSESSPEILVHTPTSSQTSVGFTITEIDDDNIGEITKIELIHANGTVAASSIDQRTFTNLLSNNDYTIKVTYIYDLNDGNGAIVLVKELNVKTEAKVAPIFSVKNESLTIDSIVAEYDISDADNILSSYEVKLYKGDILIDENENKEINFTSLNYYTGYTVKIIYMYDLNDGFEEQASTYEYNFKTLPYIDVLECSVSNTSAVAQGDTIYMSLKLDNPLGMTVESVVVNGETYNVSGTSTKNKIFIEIIYNGQFSSGETLLTIDKINAKIDGMSFETTPKNKLSDTVFIYGTLEVLKVEFVNENFEPIDWAFPADKVYVLLTLNNPAEYNITSIAVKDEAMFDNRYNITTLTKLDNNRWYYPTTSEYSGVVCVYVTGIDYSANNIQQTLICSDIMSHYYKLNSNDVKYISTPEDLKNMGSGYYYELTNDIDLAGIEWQGENFAGVFEGNGYSIKNMSLIATFKNQSAYLGLFSYGDGIIRNLNIEEATFIVDVNTDINAGGCVFCGGLVAETRFLSVYGCSIDENSMFNIKNTTRGWTCVGGFIGAAYEWSSNFVEIINSQSNVNINAEASKDRIIAGGFIGYALCTSTFTNCINTGNITTQSPCVEIYAGGLIGYIDGYAAIVMNCINTGKIKATVTESTYGIFIAGLVGSGGGKITNSVNAGEIIGYAPNSFGYFYVCTMGTKIATNTYSNFECGCGCNSKLCTKEQLNSKQFYTETLGWSKDIWDFSELDVENGKYPTLKKII